VQISFLKEKPELRYEKIRVWDTLRSGRPIAENVDLMSPSEELKSHGKRLGIRLGALVFSA